jgi:hypothetical protein
MFADHASSFRGLAGGGQPAIKKAVVASSAPRLLKDLFFQGQGLLKVEAQLKPPK